ncbi:unnamed protein product [Effrenium voratum]|nr:unnamed protein product [Effrenium voratum]
MAEMDTEPTRPPRRRQRYRVSSTWLRADFPQPEAVVEAEEALASLADCWEVLPEPEISEAAPSLRGLQKKWAQLLNHSHRQVAEKVRQELGQVHLEPLYPDEELQKEFLLARKHTEHQTIFTYHGTKTQNVNSISQKGLLIPGERGHKVANGSAHGVGIYTAHLGSSQLSRGFCDSDKMFLCAVCDTSQPMVPEAEEELWRSWKPSGTEVQTVFPKRPAHLQMNKRDVKRKSEEVLHVGDAVVTFKRHLVVPLFLISSEANEANEAKANAPTTFKIFKPAQSSRPATSQPQVLQHHAWVPEEEDWDLPQQVGRRRLAMPTSGASRVKFGDCKQGVTVWLVKDPWAGVCSKDRHVKREMLARQRALGMRRARREKQLDNGLWI